jgi:hypothetical protein
VTSHGETGNDPWKEECDDLLDTLADVINQACGDVYAGGITELDSMALSAYADGMRTLARYGRLTIIEQHGRRVIGRWVSDGQAE